MNKLIAVVGMSGTGKSVVTDYLEENNWKKLYFGGITYRLMEEAGANICGVVLNQLDFKSGKGYGRYSYKYGYRYGYKYYRYGYRYGYKYGKGGGYHYDDSYDYYSNDSNEKKL